jgi:hypothetical protein
MMKKVLKAGKPSQAKAASRKGKKQVDPGLNILKGLDEDQVAMLQQIIEVDFDGDTFRPQDPVDLFAQYLQTCAQDDDDDITDLVAELVDVLGELKVDANGGSREACGKMQAIYDLLDHAIEDCSMHPTHMMMAGKIFADAGWAVPDNLKQAMAEALQVASRDTQDPDGQDPDGNDIASALMEIVDQAGQNPFDMHELVSSLLASLPSEAGAVLLSELVACKKALIDQAVAGFVLHPDAALAQSAAEALTASALQAPVESALIERLVRMRPWLPQARQTDLDATLRAMRPNALPPVKMKLPQALKYYVSVCDGSGTSSLFVTQKLGTRYQLASAMMKPAGVVEAMILSGLSKSRMDDFVRQMKSSAPVAETDLAGVTRMLRLALADNFVSGNLPPFRLVEVVESLGLGPVHPDHASPMDIIAGLLADLPPEQTNPSAAARAHVDILDSEFQYQWFAAGEELEHLLEPVNGSKQRVVKLMKAYLPDRRHFWARQCAISALAMHSGQKTLFSSWKHLALVGRDIASDMPLDQIPLMKQIADISVRAFEGRL